MTTPSADIRCIALGSDHGGFSMKNELHGYLEQKGFTVEDVGPFSDMSVDYPLFAYKVAAMVASGKAQRGIMIDGAGIGSCMAANKVPGIRAAMCYDKKTAINSREHNNANVLTLGAGLLSMDVVKEIINVWLVTDCTADRHLRRAKQIVDLEEHVEPAGRERINNSGDTMKDIGPAELDQIAQAITAIFRSQGISAPGCDCTCCGGDCGGHCADKASDAVQEIINLGASRISYRLGGNGVPSDVAGFIDHTLLKPDASEEQVRKLCEEAREFNFASVCISPTYVKYAASLLRGSSVKVCTVIGFPSGTHLPQIKGLETRQAIRDGAKEIDMVINIGALKNRDLDLLYRDIRSVVESCEDGRAICKVIIETALLTDEEKVIASQTARRARAHFVKTSTGFASGGATAHDVALMATAVQGSGMGVKASGGIRSLEDALEMIEAGATRIGASASVQIARGETKVTESNNY